MVKTKHRKQKPPKENIVFQGGGVHGIGYVGVIRRLEIMGLRGNFKRIGGASIGALVGLLMALQIPADQILEEALNLKKKNLTGGAGVFRALVNFFSYWGFYDLQSSFTPYLQTILYKYASVRDLTFKELHERFGMELHVAVLNRSRARTEIISVHNHPQMSVIPAIIASMAFPAYFIPVKLPHSNDLYVDGGTNNNFPIYIFDEEGQANPKTLGVRSVSNRSLLFNQNVEYQPKTPTSLLEYFEGIVSIIVESGQQLYEKPQDAKRTYFMKVPYDMSAMDFNMTVDERLEIYNLGLEGSADYLAPAKHINKRRISSM